MFGVTCTWHGEFSRDAVPYRIYVYRIRNNSVEHTTVTKKPSGWQKYDSPSYEKLPSGTHNTKKSLLTRGVRVDAGWSIGNSRASLARNGGSIPPPAINPSIVQRIKTNSQYTFFL